MLLFGLNASYAHNAQGLYAIINEMTANDVPCELLEFNINDRNDEIFTQLYNKAKDHGIVGLSCYIWNVRLMCSVARDLKKLLPDTIIVFGGPEMSGADDTYSHLPYIDYIIQGEGETSLKDLALSFHAGKLPAEKIIRPCKFDKFIYTEINGASFPNHDKIRTVYYESSRGCPYSCSYCMSGNDKNAVRAKSVEDTVRDVDNIYKMCGNNSQIVNVIKFCDRTFNYNIKRANKLYKSFIDLYNKYKEKFTPPPIQFELCPTLFDKESFSILSSAPKGLFQLEIGLQSLNKCTLDAIDRHINTDEALINIERLKSFGNMNIHLDLIAGLPYESLSSFAAGLNRIYETGDFIQIGFLKMLHGTKIRREASLYGYEYKSDPPYTVLKNDFMSYSDLSLLSDIERAYEKYSSPAYRNTFAYIYTSKYKGNIFSMLQMIAVYFRKNKLYEKNISQRDSFRAFYEIFKDSGDAAIREMLQDDFYRYEKKKIFL